MRHSLFRIYFLNVVDVQKSVDDFISLEDIMLPFIRSYRVSCFVIFPFAQWIVEVALWNG